MKAIQLIVVFLLVSTATMAQNSKVEAIFKKYNKAEGFTIVNIGDKFLNKMAGDNVNADVKDALKGVSGIKVLTTEDLSSKEAKKFASEIKDLFTGNQYERIISVQEENETVGIYSNNDGDSITELGVVVSSDDEAVLVYITGKNISMSSLSALDGINMGDMPH